MPPRRRAAIRTIHLPKHRVTAEKMALLIRWISFRHSKRWKVKSLERWAVSSTLS